MHIQQPELVTLNVGGYTETTPTRNMKTTAGASQGRQRRNETT